MDRREFMTSATASAGMAAFVPFIGIDGIADFDEKKKKKFDYDAFTEALNSDSKFMLSAALAHPEEDDDALIEYAKGSIYMTEYAVENIAPKKIAEFALVAAASWIGKEFKPIIDEVVRLRAGKGRILPHHPVFNNKFLDMHGTLPFWQQTTELIEDLTSKNQHEAREVMFKIRDGELLPDASSASQEQFAVLLNPKYRKELSKEEFALVCEGLRLYSQLSYDYFMAAIRVSGAFIKMHEIA